MIPIIWWFYISALYLSTQPLIWHITNTKSSKTFCLESSLSRSAVHLSFDSTWHDLMFYKWQCVRKNPLQFSQTNYQKKNSNSKMKHDFLWTVAVGKYRSFKVRLGCDVSAIFLQAILVFDRTCCWSGCMPVGLSWKCVGACMLELNWKINIKELRLGHMHAAFFYSFI